MIGLTAKTSEPKVFKGNKNHSKKIPAPEGTEARILIFPQTNSGQSGSLFN
jgi:hypothetical protein